MITASPKAYMKYFKEYKYADEVIGTELLYENNIYQVNFRKNNLFFFCIDFRIFLLYNYDRLEGM